MRLHEAPELPVELDLLVEVRLQKAFVLHPAQLRSQSTTPR